jgi:hypothetical protein
LSSVFTRISLGIIAILVTGVLVITALYLTPLAPPLVQNEKQDLIIIDNVNIVDVIGGTILKHKQVVIEAGIITNIREAESRFPKDNGYIVAGNNQYLMPGLWDMHSHLAFNEAPQITMPLYIANGVLHLRDMQGIMNIVEKRRRWAESINNHELLGPRIVGSADHIVGDNYDRRDVEKVVLKTSESTNAFIKIYSQIKEPRFLKLAGLAEQHDVQFAGHYPLSIDPILASNAGQRSFEHAHLFIDNASTKAPLLRQYYSETFSNNGVAKTHRPTKIEILDTFEQQKFNLLVAAMVQNNTYFVPTHITKRYEAFSHDNEFLSDGKLKYIPFMVQNLWADDAQSMKAYSADTLSQYYRRGLELTGQAHRQGVKILVGTDTYDPYSFPGFSLHNELAQLTKAGLSNAEALASATILPATYFQRQLKMGSVDIGKMGDVILLEKNPLADIQNTKNIKMVIFDSAVYDEQDLMRQKDYVETNVNGVNNLLISVKMIVAMFQDNTPEARNAGY